MDLHNVNTAEVMTEGRAVAPGRPPSYPSRSGIDLPRIFGAGCEDDSETQKVNSVRREVVIVGEFIGPERGDTA